MRSGAPVSVVPRSDLLVSIAIELIDGRVTQAPTPRRNRRLPICSILELMISPVIFNFAIPSLISKVNLLVLPASSEMARFQLRHK